MSVPAAYLATIVIWSLTPLGVVMSNETIAPVTAAWMRMAIAAGLGWVLLKALRLELPWHKKALATYGCSVIGIYFAMILTYFAARSVPSGIISVIFALSPLFSGVLAALILKQGALRGMQWVALGVSFSGIWIIFGQSEPGLLGRWEHLLMLLIAAPAFSLSGVLIKKIDAGIHHFSTTVGSLLVSMPLYALSWWVLEGSLPELDWTSRSPVAVVMLALFGSLLGFSAYFYVLHRLSAATVTLITMITPIFALWAGSVWNDEQISAAAYTGSAVVLVGLALYFYGLKMQNGVINFMQSRFTKRTV